MKWRFRESSLNSHSSTDRRSDDNVRNKKREHLKHLNCCDDSFGASREFASAVGSERQEHNFNR